MPRTLDPVGLWSLAEWLRDQVWLDMRIVDFGLAERVRIDSLTIRLTDHEVELYQEYLADDSSTVECGNLTVPGDSVWWSRPTQFDLADVKPLHVVLPVAQRGMMDVAPIVAAAIRALAENENMDPVELEREFNDSPYSRTGQGSVDRRHKILWIIYELTDMAPVACAAACGYKSPMPWQSARTKYMNWDTSSGKYLARPEYQSLMRQLVARTRAIGRNNWEPRLARTFSVL